jgi:predicted Rossmann fold flavoprotein
LVIGGGAAGMTAAIFAARNGAKVTVLEQLPKVGRKILATGNGRCNFTNVNMDIGKYHGSNVKFAYGVLGRYGYMDTIRFFEDLGLYWIEEDGRVYPASQQASSVLDVLRYEMDYLGVEEACDVGIEEIAFQSNGFTIKLKDGSKIFGDKVILATGGKANPGLGSKGSGYELAKSLGHKIMEPFPSLVQIKLESPYLKGIAGVRHTGRASIEKSGESLREDFGEVQFTDYGVSGIPVLQLSRIVGEYLKTGDKLLFCLDMFPRISKDELFQLLLKRNNLRPEKPLHISFIGLINKRLINALLKEGEISDVNMPCRNVTREQLDRFAGILKKWSFNIIGTKSWSEAQVTAGGVSVSDINPKTMESKLVPGLYFAGEILDIDGDCGGYNLHWAWSTGSIAGISAAMNDS